MIKNYFKIAWRNLIQSKVYSFINIFGLALGMAVTLIIGLWVNDELSYNNYFSNYKQIAYVAQSQTINGKTGAGPAIPRPLEFALRENYNDNFKHIVMSSWTNSLYLKYGDVNVSRTGNFMQEAAPEMLDLKILKGEKNGLQEINSIMLSTSSAKALFGNMDPIGKIIKVNSKNDMKVTAVYKDIPTNNTFEDLHYIIPWEAYLVAMEWVKNSRDAWGNNSFQLFVQIAENTSMKKVTSIIKDVKLNANEDTKQYKPHIFLFPMKDWHLRAKFENGIQAGGRIEYVWLFGIIGLFVLILACINFMNLSTARSEKRAKEVGIRKSIGSTRNQLIYQFLSESFLVVIFAFIVAIVLVLLSLNGFNYLAQKEINFPWTNLTFWFASILFILFTSLLSGSYPALYLSSFEPVKVLKGTFRVGKFAALPRKVLVVVQFTVSVTLIIGTLIVMQQIQYTKDRPSGYDKEGLIQIPTLSEYFSDKNDLMRNEFINSKAVIEMSTSSSPTTEVWSNRSGYTWEGKQENYQEDFAWTEVSYEYAKSLGLKFVSGRDFSRKFASDSNAVILNQTAVKQMGIIDPIGKFIRDTDKENPEEPMLIIGVVEDMIMQSPYEPVKASLYVFDRNGESNFYNLKLNPKQSISKNLNIIENVFKKHFPSLPFKYDFVDQQYAKKFAAEERIANLAGIFTALAIFISCLGLFGLASFVAEQRTKEIGVRKVLGASVGNVWILLSKDFMLLVIISLIIASPLAYYFMSIWIQKYTYHIDISFWVFVTAGVGAIVITMLTVSFQAIKAGRSNPVEALRTE